MSPSGASNSNKGWKNKGDKNGEHLKRQTWKWWGTLFSRLSLWGWPGGVARGSWPHGCAPQIEMDCRKQRSPHGINYLLLPGKFDFMPLSRAAFFSSTNGNWLRLVTRIIRFLRVIRLQELLHWESRADCQQNGRPEALTCWANGMGMPSLPSS